MASPPKLDDLSFLKEIPDLPADVPSGEPSLPGVMSTGRGTTTPKLPAFLGAAPDRAQVRRRWSQALLLALAWMGAHLAVHGVRQDFSALPLSYILVQVAAPAIIGVISLLLALSPGRLGLGVALGATATLALAGPLSFLCAALGMPAPFAAAEGTWASHLVCLDLTLIWMSVPLLLFAFHLRRAFASGAGFRSALVGAACGLLAGAMMNLHCSSMEQIHMGLGHAVPVGIGTLIGGVVLSRWLKA